MHCKDLIQADVLTGAMKLLISIWIQNKKKIFLNNILMSKSQVGILLCIKLHTVQNKWYST